MFAKVFRITDIEYLSYNFETTKARTALQYFGPGLPSADTRPLGKPTSRTNQGGNKKIPPLNHIDSQVPPGRRTASAGPDAISTGLPCRCAPHAYRAPSSLSPG